MFLTNWLTARSGCGVEDFSAKSKGEGISTR